MLFFTTNIHLCAVGKERRDEGNLTKKNTNQKCTVFGSYDWCCSDIKKIEQQFLPKKSLNDAI